MAGSLERLVRNLEAGDGKEYPECGFAGDWSKVEFEVAWDDFHVVDRRSDAYDPIEPVEPERCEGCGEALEIFVTWDDAWEDK